jgi:hypothetical protein
MVLGVLKVQEVPRLVCGARRRVSRSDEGLKHSKIFSSSSSVHGTDSQYTVEHPSWIDMMGVFQLTLMDNKYPIPFTSETPTIASSPRSNTRGPPCVCLRDAVPQGNQSCGVSSRATEVRKKWFKTLSGGW